VQLKKSEAGTVLTKKSLPQLVDIPKMLEINFSGLNAVDENKKTYDYWTVGYNINTSDQQFESKGAVLTTSMYIGYNTKITTNEV
jgi:hypothetical protein